MLPDAPRPSHVVRRERVALTPGRSSAAAVTGHLIERVSLPRVRAGLRQGSTKRPATSHPERI